MTRKYLKSAVFCLLLIQLVFISPQKFLSQTGKQKIKEIDYCSLFSGELKDFESEIVKTRAFMSYSNLSRVDGGDTFLYSPNCNSGDFFAYSKWTENAWRKWDEFFFKLPKEKEFMFEVKLSGKLESQPFPQYGHLGWSRHQFEAVVIESITDITATAVKPDVKAKTTIDKLKEINHEIMSYFLGSDGDVDRFIAEEFILDDLAGNRYNKKNYRELVGKGLFGNIKNYVKQLVNIGQFDYRNGVYKVFGYVLVCDKNDKCQALDFENSYQYKNKTWLLTEIKFTKPSGF